MDSHIPFWEGKSILLQKVRTAELTETGAKCTKTEKELQ